MLLMANTCVMKLAAEPNKQTTTTKKTTKAPAKKTRKVNVNEAATAQKKPKRSGKPKRKKRKRISRFQLISRGIMLGIVAIFVWCMYCYVMLAQHPYSSPVKAADAGIVLGAALWNNEPSPALKERLDRAFELYDEGLIEYIILSGGRPDYIASLSEAEGMQNYLIKRGVPATQLIMEPHSHNTYENLLFSSVKAQENDIESVIIITHSYHGLRAQEIAHYLEYDDVQVSGVQSQVLNSTYHHTREILAYTKWKINSLLLHLGLSI